MSMITTMYGGNRPDYIDCAEPDDFDGYPDVTFSPDLVNVVTPVVAYQENSVVLGGSVSAYDNCDGDRPDCVDYDELGDCDGCPGVTFLADPVNVFLSKEVTYCWLATNGSRDQGVPLLD